MKRVLFTLVIFATSLIADVKFTHIFDIYDIAKEENKLVIIMLSREGCPGCEHMQDVVLKDIGVSEFISKNYIIANMDVYEEAVPEELEYFGTPTFYFLDAEENILKRVNGGENAKKFLQTLKEVQATKK